VSGFYYTDNSGVCGGIGTPLPPTTTPPPGGTTPPSTGGGTVGSVWFPIKAVLACNQDNKMKVTTDLKAGGYLDSAA